MSAPGAPHDLADVVFRVGRAYGMTADRGIYQAVAVKDGRITAVGRSRDELDSFVGLGTAVIDDPELVLYPAFNDTHNHQLLAARDLDYVSLERARSVDELVQALGEPRTGCRSASGSSRHAAGTEPTCGKAGCRRHVSWTRRAPTIPSSSSAGATSGWATPRGLVTRGTRTAGVQGPEYRVDTYTAIRLYTAAGGELLREERSVGILAPGAFADVVGFRADLLNCPVDDLPSQQPALTLVGGRPVHDPDGLLGSAGVMSGFGIPQSIDGEGAQAVSEWEGLLSGVEDVSGYQPRAQSLGKVAQAGQVFAADGGSGLHLDGDHPAVRGFQDGVYLGLVLGAVVMQARAFLAPGELAGQFHQHERLDHGSGGHGSGAPGR